jgi:sigma-B regulation protein RsbU (phosphoserine phosphatase)
MAALAEQDVTTFRREAMPRVLIADDQADILEALRLLLKRQGYEIRTATSPTGILEALDTEPFDLILMDLNYARDTTSGREGMDLLALLNTRGNTPPIVVMTGWGSVGLAVEAMQRGVGDFVEKPWENVRLLEILRAQIERGWARREELRHEALRVSQANQTTLQLHRQEMEIEEARQIQQGFLPKEIPQVPGFEIVGAWEPARIVGGDYFDVLRFDESKLGLCIADVAGKGVPAALLMSNLQATVRGLASAALPPAQLCARTNHSIGQNIAADRFVTFFYGVLDGASRRFTYTNAGHNAPIHLRRDGSHTRLRQGGDVLGVFSSCAYEQGETNLTPGDRLLLFTDGVTEARNAIGEEFGEQRLLRILSENRERSAAALQKKILEVLADFNEGELADDATLIVVAVN